MFNCKEQRATASAFAQALLEKEIWQQNVYSKWKRKGKLLETLFK